MKQKLFPLCVALLALVLCNTPLLAEDFTVGGIYYKITSSTGKTVEVTYRGNYESQYSNEYSGAVTIPESVTYNGDTYSVAGIGAGAFGGCSSLTSVVIPNSVTSIGELAFWGCSRLTSVEIPNSVTSIGELAFNGCSSLTSIVVAKDNAIYDSRDNCNAIIETQTNTLIAGCSKTTIPNSVTSIGDNAFLFCSRLTSVEIPNSVTSIGYYAFEGCSSLTSVEIPNSVTSIGSGAFDGCSSLTTATVGCSWETNSLYDFGVNVIVNATLHSYENGICTVCHEKSLRFEVNGIYYNITSSTNKTVAVTHRGSSYDSYSDEYSGAVTIPESVTYNGNTYSVTSIGWSAFRECSSLTSVVIPNSVTSIGDVAFCGCSSLTSIEIPNSVTSIGVSAFDGCSNLTYVVIPNSVTSIGDYAFYCCRRLTSVEIPNSVTSIGGNAFQGCSSLTSVVIPNSVTSIGKGVFHGCSSLTSVEIPNSVTSIGNSAFGYCSSLTSVVIPNSVTSIGSYAFYNCSSLTAVVIPNSVTSIGYCAFYNCSSLTSVEIPSSVTSIEEGAFCECSSLTSVEIPNSVTSIGYEAFRGCSSLTTATVGCSWKTNPLYEFNENVTIHTTLHSYENGICTICGDEENHEEIMPEYIELVEGNDFTNGITREVAQVSYNRTLPNLKWNALYLPVEIPVSELRDNYDVAYFNNMHAYDRNNDGTVDEMDMEIFFITEGTLHANHPYFIRAKNNAAKQMNLVLTDVTLHSTEAANCTSITTSSAYMNFELKGVYKRIYVSNTNIPVNPNPEAPISNDYDSDESIYGCYAITASGAWSPIAVGSYLNPFRLYLKMTDRDGTPVKMDQALQTIRIRVHGEDGTTDIEEHCINGQQSTTIYDLQGRRVVNPAKGIYIVNGKKVMIK